MECLILKTEPVGEDDLRMTALTHEGERREALARSARLSSSRVRAGFVPVCVSDVMFVRSRGSWIVRNAFPMLAFPAFRTSLPASACASLLAAMFAESVGSTPQESDGAGKDFRYIVAARVFRDLHTAVAAREDGGTLARRFCGALLQALSLAGIAPAFDRCALCGARNVLIAVSASSGGTICPACELSAQDSRRMSRAALHDLAHRRISAHRGDTATLLRFSLACAAWHMPSVAPQCRWAASVFFRQSRERHTDKVRMTHPSATMGSKG